MGPLKHTSHFTLLVQYTMLPQQSQQKLLSINRKQAPGCKRQISVRKKARCQGNPGNGLKTIMHCRELEHSQATEPAQHPVELDPSLAQRIRAMASSEPYHSPPMQNLAHTNSKLIFPFPEQFFFLLYSNYPYFQPAFSAGTCQLHRSAQRFAACSQSATV